MSKITLPPALAPDGSALSDEAQDDLLHTEELIAFSHTKRDRDGNQILDDNEQPIQLARHSIIVDTSRVTAVDLITYQKANGEIYAQAQARQAEVEAHIQAANARATRKKRSPDEPDEQARAEAMAQLTDTLDLFYSQRLAKATLLAKLVQEWTVRSQGKMIEPTSDFLLERTGPGADAYEALDEWYFPTSNGAEEETGTPENPSTPAP